MKEDGAMKMIIAGAALLLGVSVCVATLEDEEESEHTIIIIEERTTSAEQSVTKEVSKQAEYHEEEELMINLNTADEAELELLEGIGESIAVEIVKYRNNHGGFRNIEELMNVSGIGEKVYLKIKDNIYVENPVYETTTEATEAAVTEAPTESEEVTEPNTITVEYPLDLNTATKEELMTLPHVGEEEAEGIIELRNKIGVFSHVYELLYVEELEQKEVAEIIEFVTIGK